MRKANQIATVPVLLKLMQSWLWYNDSYKVFFSTRHTNNPQEYMWFMLHVQSGKRTHGKYRPTTDGILVQFLHGEYKVKELVTMRRYDIVMLQFTNVDNELDFHNFMGIPVPVEKGEPYKLE